MKSHSAPNNSRSQSRPVFRSNHSKMFGNKDDGTLEITPCDSNEVLLNRFRFGLSAKRRHRRRMMTVLNDDCRIKSIATVAHAVMEVRNLLLIAHR